jgi:hypothetical protein
VKPDLRYLPAAVGTGGELTFADLETEKRQRRFGNTHARGLQGDGSSETSAHAVPPLSEGVSVRGGDERMTVQAIEVAMQHG